MKIKSTLLYVFVILQTISCYISNKSLFNMNLDGSDTKLALSKRRDIIFYSVALNTLGIRRVSAEQSIIDINKISSKDIIKCIEEEQTNIFEKSISSVCFISTEYTSMADKYNLNKDDLPKGVGTGFIWDKKGHIITNFHVINKVDKAFVTITDKDSNKKRI